ncbi:CcdB family protein [Marinobacter salexigens]|uniref:CcdB family protein n=1 Tax=Marinobacter salexigens TaxID=1925763 RepID=A0ABS6A4J8_9GAMM|nr:CcdB family protein [Marinobacter salexigens]MBU2872998.1 CcdB family protein [Marinobacter salexigens]
MGRGKPDSNQKLQRVRRTARLLLTPQISSVPEKQLKNPIGSLSHFRDQIVEALDLAITGI